MDVLDRHRDAEASTFLTPASTVLLSEEVVERIREAILTGEFEPGDRLREEQLARSLQVSRGPVRSALLQLEREGMVVRRRNRGALVAHLSRADLEEVYSLRHALEPVACAWAARNAVESDLAALQRVIDDQLRLTSKVRVQDAAEADLTFHDVLYAAARHRRLLGLWQDLRPQVYLFLLARKYVRTREFREVMVVSHTRILDIIRAGDEEAARAIATEHVQTSYLRVLEGYRDSGANGGADGG
jgi:DNA-binding GntR family transcriptional regulator